MKPLDPRLLRLSRSARGFVAAAAAAGVVRVAATIAIAWGIADALSTAIAASGHPDRPWTIVPPVVVLVIAFAVRALGAWATDDLATRAAARVKGELRTRVLERAAKRGPEWLAGRSSAGFATTLGPGLDALDAYFGRYLPQLVLSAVATPMLVVAIGWRDLTSVIIIVCTLPVIPVFMILIGWATQAAQRRQQDALARLGGAFLEAVEGIATLKVFGRARRQVQRIGAVTDDYRSGVMRLLRLSFVSGFALELAASLAVALVAISIGVRLVDTEMGLPAALFVLVLAPEAFAPIRQVGAEFHAASDGVEAAAAVLDVLDDGDAQDGAAQDGAAQGGAAQGGAAQDGAAQGGTAQGGSVPTVRPAVADAARSADELVLAGLVVRRADVVIGPVDARFRPGTITALTGPSGSGKSSIIAAMRGVLRAEGEVVLGGEQGLQTGAVTWMDQRPRLVAGTIAANIAMHDEPAADAVVSALAAAAFDIDPMTVLGADGSGLSGGQAQRVAFARAVYRWERLRTPVVICDEPTSALDVEAEAHVVATLRRMADEGAIVVVASHRPAVVAAADWRLRLASTGHVTSTGQAAAVAGQSAVHA